MFPRENHSNGYEQVGGMGHTHSHIHRERVRRGARRSRGSSSSHSLRVLEQSQPHHHRPPCTDFDLAYFHSYAHLGIHQEMIKVPLPLLLSFPLSPTLFLSLFTSCFPMQDRVRTETYREAIMQHQSFIAGKVIHLFTFSLFSTPPPFPVTAI